MEAVKRSKFLLLVAAFAVAVLSGISSARAESSDPVVVLKTSVGDIELQLDPKHAPVTTANFLAYVKKGFYDGTVFHRVIPGFVVQGGGMGPDGVEKETMLPIKNEAANGLKNLRGTISMARTSDPNSATSQFFLNLVDNDNLNPGGVSAEGYAVFGKIIKGLDVMDKIAEGGSSTGRPMSVVTLISAKVK